MRDVQALPPRDVLLVLAERDDDDAVLRVRVSANPDGPRLHLQIGRVHGHKGPVGPFFQRVAAELAGARVARLVQVGDDRIARLELRDVASGGRAALWAELVGRHANLVLTDGADRVDALLVEQPASAKRPPRLVRGEPWAPPPGRATRGPAGESLAQALPEPPPPPGPPDGRAARLVALAPLSWRVESSFGAGVDEAHVQRERKTLAERAQRKLRRARSLVAGLEQRRVATQGVERGRQDGELLKASLGQVRRGMTSIELADWFEDGAPPRAIELDPKLSPQQNLQRLFDRAKKLERGGAEVERELARARAKAEALAALVERAAACEDVDALDALEREATDAGLLDPPQKAPERRTATVRKPYKSFAAGGGQEIRVGRSARDNDELSFRHARGNDVWLHTTDAPGSHVVLRVERNAEPSQDDVLDAAHLAIWFSPLRDSGRASVHVARCKEVHKPRGAKPGLVTLSGGRTLFVRIEPARLRRLLSPERAADDA